MKKYLLAFAVLTLLFACNPENNGNQNNPNELTTTGEALEVTDYSATLTGYANLPLEMGDAEVGIMYDKVQSFESAKKAVAKGLDGNNKFTVTATDLEPSTTYFFKSYVQNGMAIKYGSVKSFTTKESTIPAGAVDLGIVMTREDGTSYKLYWATSNLCEDGLCANPEDYGDYYAWGETEPKDNYSWATYKWCNGSYKTLTKYNNDSYYGTVDNKTEFMDYDYEDDAVRQALGGKWRVPTNAEWTKLLDNCTWTWVENYNGSRINGRMVTSKTNSNSIFLPAAGYRDYSSLYDAGSFGLYWSSSLYTAYPSDARSVDFSSDDVRRGYGRRCVGQSVRPVTEIDSGV